jgi:hypothetical protein
MPESQIDIKTDIHGSDKEIKRVNTELENMQTQASEASTKLSGLWQQIVKGQIAVNLLGKAYREIVDLIKSSISAAADSEKAQKGMESALFSTGRTASYLSEYFRNSAKELQRLTKYSDEETLRAQALMLQLSNLDKEGIQKATKGAMGLATVFGMDLAEASMLVGKWMDGNTERMSRYGIRVSNTMTAEEKRNSVIEQLLEYYPRVESETHTYSGRLAQLKNAYDEVKEAAGRYITENEGVLKGLNWLSDALYDLAGAETAVRDAKKSGEAIDRAWSERFYIAANATKMTKEEVVKLIAQFTELGPVVKGNSSYSAALTGHLVEQERAVTTNWQALASYIIHGNAGPAMLAAFRAAVISTIKPLKDLKAETGTGILIDPEAERKRLEQLKKIAEELKKTHADARKWLEDDQRKYYEKLKKDEEKSAEDIKKVHEDAWKRLREGQDKFYADQKEAAEKYKQKMRDLFDATLSGVRDLFSAWSSLSQANADSEIANINRGYDERKQKILDSMMDEEEKAAAIKNLESEQALAVRKVQREQAGAHKDFAIFDAILNTAAAITMTFRQFGWPFGLIPAALMAAAGALQIAAIKAQPIPLAQGFEGMVRKPTLFLAGEAGPEHLSVRPGERGGSGQNIRITLAVPIYIAGHKFEEKLIEIIGRISTSGRLKIAAKAIA